MSTGDRVLTQLEKVIAHHQRVHHHAVREARELRARIAAEQAGLGVQPAQVPDLEPVGMPAGDTPSDPVAGL